MTLTEGFDVDSTMSYLRKDSKYNRRYVTPGAEVNTGLYETRPVRVKDIRPQVDEYSLHTTGFQLFHHESKITDFTDSEQVDKIYFPELENFVKHATGADKVICFRPTIRKSPSVKQTSDQPVAGDVHVDYTPRRAAVLGRQYCPESAFFYNRLLIVSCWRTFSPPPQDWPLAVLDPRSLSDEEGLTNTVLYQDKVPEDLENLPDISEKDVVGEGYAFNWREGHKWCYFSAMTRDELLVFKLNDSERRSGNAWRTPHCAFWNGDKEAAPRESIEVRMCCYFK